ncbi:MAG: carboxypeptidase regulatory-like domain-containing protein [Armatimonadota bacterium]
MRNNDAARVSLWVKGQWLIDSYQVPNHDAPHNSGAITSFATMIEAQFGDPAALQNISFAAGDEVYVQINGNDFTGLDFTIAGPGSPSTIKGKITAAGTTAPVEGVVVELVGTGKSDISDVNGNYVISDVEEGGYTLGVYKNGYFSQTSGVTVATGLDVTKDMSITSFSGLDCARMALATANKKSSNAANVNDGNARTDGWVSDLPETGDWVLLTWSEPITIAKILVDSAGPTQDYKAQSSSNGTTWTNIAALTSAETGHTHWVDTVSLATPVTTKYIRLQLDSPSTQGMINSVECHRPSGTIAGYVKDATGAAIAGATVWAYEATGTTSYVRGGSRLPMHATTIGDGSYTITVPEGTAMVSAWLPDSIAVSSSNIAPLSVVTDSYTNVPDLAITVRAGIGGSCAGFADNFNDIADGMADPRWDITDVGYWFGMSQKYQAGLYGGNYTQVKTSSLAPCADSAIDVDTDGSESGIVARYKDSTNYLLLVNSFNELLYWHERYNGTWPTLTPMAQVVLDSTGRHMRSVVAGNKVQGFVSDAFNTYWTQVGTPTHLTGSGQIGLYSNKTDVNRNYDNFVAHQTTAPQVPPVAPGSAKQAGPGWFGAIAGVVTAVFADYNYFVLEDEGRSSAIICSPLPAAVPSEDEVVVVTGTIRSDYSLEVGDVRPTGAINDLGALGINNKNLSGADASSGLENTNLLVTSWGKVLDEPVRFEDGTVRFHVTDGSAQAGGPTVVVPLPGITPLLLDNFDAGKSTGWQDPDPQGTSSASGGKLVADDGGNIAVVANQSVDNVVVEFDFNIDSQAGALLRFNTASNFVLAFYHTGNRAIAFHEKVDGNWGGWCAGVPAGSILGPIAHLTASANGSTVTLTVTDGVGSATTSYTLASLLGPGQFGVYHDGQPTQYFDNFEAYIPYTQGNVLADAVQVIIPASVAISDADLPHIDDYIRATGIEGAGLTMGGNLRAITVRKPVDLGLAQ